MRQLILSPETVALLRYEISEMLKQDDLTGYQATDLINLDIALSEEEAIELIL